MSILLSICIPTYNRENYLKQLLDNILKQLNDLKNYEIEICISDNASTDNTKELVFEYKSKYSRITYFRWDRNMGADANYLKVIEIASGEYCWFLGSDDLIVPDAIVIILSKIKENNDIYLVNRIICDINMNPIKRTPILKENIDTKKFHFGTYEKIENYLKSIKEFTGIFSYLSSIVFRKKQWDDMPFNKKFLGTAYAHSYILLSMFKKNITLRYVDEYLVLNRGSNDSFSSDGVIKRIKLDFDGFKTLFLEIFDKKYKLERYYINLLKQHYKYRELLIILINSSSEDRTIFFRSIKGIYNIFLFKIVVAVILFTRFLYRKTFKNLISVKKT